MPEPPARPTRDHVHTWFSLSYANYAVLPRTLLQSMPDEWQACFVQLMRELDAAFAHVPQAEGYDVRAGRWMRVSECTEDELRLAGVKGSEETYEQTEEGGVELVDDGQERTWSRLSDGATLYEHDSVFMPGEEPVPHYNRGRAYIAPAIQTQF